MAQHPSDCAGDHPTLRLQATAAWRDRLSKGLDDHSPATAPGHQLFQAHPAGQRRSQERFRNVLLQNAVAPLGADGRRADGRRIHPWPYPIWLPRIDLSPWQGRLDRQAQLEASADLLASVQALRSNP